MRLLHLSSLLQYISYFVLSSHFVMGFACFKELKCGLVGFKIKFLFYHQLVVAMLTTLDTS